MCIRVISWMDMFALSFSDWAWGCWQAFLPSHRPKQLPFLNHCDGFWRKKKKWRTMPYLFFEQKCCKSSKCFLLMKKKMTTVFYFFVNKENLLWSLKINNSVGRDEKNSDHFVKKNKNWTPIHIGQTHTLMHVRMYTHTEVGLFCMWSQYCNGYDLYQKVKQIGKDLSIYQ